MRFKNYLLLISVVALGAVGCTSETTDDPDAGTTTNPNTGTTTNPNTGTTTEPDTGTTDPDTGTTDPDEPEVDGYTLTYQASEYDPEGFTVTFYTDFRFTDQITTAEENTTVWFSLGTYDYNLYKIKDVLVNGVSATLDTSAYEYCYVVTENIVVTIDWSLKGMYDQFIKDSFGDPYTMNYSVIRTCWSRTVALDPDTFEETGEETVQELTPYLPYNSYVDNNVLRIYEEDDKDNVMYFIYDEESQYTNYYFWYNSQQVSGSLSRHWYTFYQSAPQTINCYYSIYQTSSYVELETNVYTVTGYLNANYLYIISGANTWYDSDSSKEYPTVTFDHINKEIKIEFVTYSIAREDGNGGYERYQEYYVSTIKNVGTTEIDTSMIEV